MLVYCTAEGLFAKRGGHLRKLAGISWGEALTHDYPIDVLTAVFDRASDHTGIMPPPIAPIAAGQGVWAAGVTYWRSRTARMEESKDAGGGDFYARVYDAARPELFYKSSPHRVVGPGQPIRIRRDSKWNVLEPELTLAVNAAGKIVGYTVGNDVSSRDIEGENPLYLPQAKVYSGSCALGPAVLMTTEPLPTTAPITLQIRRAGAVAFEGATTLAQLRRRPDELVEYLPRQHLPSRLLPHDRHRHYPTGRFHAAQRR